MEILFVCTGNTCRSCMSEVFFNEAVSRNDKLAGHYSAKSVGISASEGEHASDESISVMSEDFNLSLSNHKARRILCEDVKNSDLILAMTIFHKEYVISKYPDAVEKIFTLKEYANRLENINTCGFSSEDIDVDDPYRMGPENYRKCAAQLKILIEKTLKRLESKK